MRWQMFIRGAVVEKKRDTHNSQSGGCLVGLLLLLYVLQLKLLIPNSRALVECYSGNRNLLWSSCWTGMQEGYSIIGFRYRRNRKLLYLVNKQNLNRILRHQLLFDVQIVNSVCGLESVPISGRYVTMELQWIVRTRKRVANKLRTAELSWAKSVSK